MTGDETARLIYLALLGAVIAGWLLLQNRQRLGQMAQQAAVWGFIFVGAIVTVGLWGDLRRTAEPPRAQVVESGRIAIPRAPDGHYKVTLDVNGVPLHFIVDTGASGIVLTREAARRAGIDTDALAFYGEAMTANGPVRTAPVRIGELQLGPVTDRNVRAWVNEGEMRESLLGMTYLQRFERVEISGDTLWLTR